MHYAACLDLPYAGQAAASIIKATTIAPSPSNSGVRWLAGALACEDSGAASAFFARRPCSKISARIRAQGRLEMPDLTFAPPSSRTSARPTPLQIIADVSPWLGLPG